MFMIIMILMKIATDQSLQLREDDPYLCDVRHQSLCTLFILTIIIIIICVIIIISKIIIIIIVDHNNHPNLCDLRHQSLCILV